MSAGGLCLCPAVGKAMDNGPLFPDACFGFQVGWGHGGRLTSVWMFTFTPIPSTAPSVTMILAFRTHQGELNLKTSPFFGTGSVFSCSLSIWKLWGCRGGVLLSGSESGRDKFTCQNKEGHLGAVLVPSERWEKPCPHVMVG